MTRIDLKPYCFEISAKDKTYYVSCKSDEELYSWMDEIYNVSTAAGCSGCRVADMLAALAIFCWHIGPYKLHPQRACGL